MDVKEVVEQADDSVGTLSCCNTLIYQVVDLMSIILLSYVSNFLELT